MFYLLDRIARRWLDWRVDRAIRKDKVKSDVFVKRIEAQEQGVKFVLACPTLAVMADEAAGMLEQFEAENYLEFKAVSRQRMPPRIIRITLQYNDGLSPAEMVDRLKAEKAALEKQLAARG